MGALSLRDALKERHILLTGASGFLGKAWLALLLDRLPEIGRVTILMRPRGAQSGHARLESMLATTPVFRHLHERLGGAFSELAAEKLRVVEGCVEQPNFGIAPELVDELKGSLDLIVNSAGVTDFDPDPRDALSANVEGALNALELSRRTGARLLHVSTCFVAGNRDGEIEETVLLGASPNGRPYDVEGDYAELWRCMAGACDSSEAELRGGDANSGRMRRVRRRLVDAARERAESWGFPNIYTYSKAIAEQFLTHRLEPTDQVSIFRPAIIESSVSYPFAGWNEGFNGSGPLAYLLGTWFRLFPATLGNAFDVVPIDETCKALTMVAGALIEGCAAPVYHCGTSDLNTLTIDRACELTALAHRRHLRAHGKGLVERELLSRWESVATEGVPLLSIENIRRTARGLGQGLRDASRHQSLPGGLRKQLSRLGLASVYADRQLKPIERLLDAYRPFTQTHRQRFICRQLGAIEPEVEFRFAVELINWRDYWVKIHMPALRLWCFPRLEGKTPEGYEPTIPFVLDPRVEPSIPAARAARGAG